ncbi:HNH endonuclease [Mycobacteroides abscessus]
MTTLDEFMAINPNAYMAVVDTWRPQTKQFKEAFDDYKRWAGAPAGTEWTGRTANAAYERAALDCHGSDNADDAAEDIVRLASATITHEVLPPLNNGKTMIENALRAKDQGVSIDQSFNMTYTPPEGMSEETAAKNRQHVEEAERQIKEYVANWEKGCQTLRGQADTAAQKITGCINPKTALVDGRKILRDAMGSKPGDGPATATATTVSATSGKPHGIIQGMQDIAGAGDTKPAGTTGAETVADYKKWYPKDAVNVGDKNVDPAKLGGAGSIPGVRDNSERTPQALQRPVLRPEQVEQFKADTRRALYEMKVPPEQIEARVNAAVQDAQTPHFKPEAPSASPTDPKYISRDFGEQFNRFTNGISDSAQRTVDGQIEQAKILTGQAGPGAPGVAEAWKQVGLGAIQQAHELTTDPLAAPKMGIEQAKDFYNNPSDFIGKNIIHGTEALAGGAVGGEAAAGARGLLGDLTGTEGRALAHGIDSSHPGPTVEHNGGGGGGFSDAHSGGVGDHGGGPGGHGMPGGNPTSFDFDNPLQTARPEFNIPHPVDVMSPELRGLAEQHLTGSGETVLGPYAPQTGGPSYIEVAGERGASYFDIGDAWNTSTPTQQLAANQHVLDTAISNRDTIKLSVPFDEIRPDTYTGAELRYIEKHGYVRVDDTTYIPPGGQR